MRKKLFISLLFACALISLLSVHIVHVRLGLSGSLGTEVFLLAVAMALYMIVSLIYIMRRYGQGGARIEQGAVEAPLTNGLADNTHWLWGVFYVDRGDPSIMVEKRWGFGYTLNYGNPKALIFAGSFLVLFLTLIGVGLSTTVL